jgi:hypothetical protein
MEQSLLLAVNWLVYYIRIGWANHLSELLKHSNIALPHCYKELLFDLGEGQLVELDLVHLLTEVNEARLERLLSYIGFMSIFHGFISVVVVPLLVSDVFLCWFESRGVSYESCLPFWLLSLSLCEVCLRPNTGSCPITLSPLRVPTTLPYPCSTRPIRPRHLVTLYHGIIRLLASKHLSISLHLK